MPKWLLYDLTGKQFGKWTVLYRTKNKVSPCGQQQTAYLCRCKCGTEQVVEAGHLKTHKSKIGSSKGCINCHRRNAPVKKADINTFLFWSKYHKTEGTIKEWQENAIAFYEYVATHRPSEKHRARLKEPLAGLRPDNIVFLTRQEMYNTGSRYGQVLITKNGITHTMAEWAKIEGVTRQAIEMRIKTGKWKDSTTREKIGYEKHELNQRIRMKNGKYKNKVNV